MTAVYWMNGITAWPGIALVKCAGYFIYESWNYEYHIFYYKMPAIL